MIIDQLKCAREIVGVLADNCIPIGMSSDVMKLAEELILSQTVEPIDPPPADCETRVVGFDTRELADDEPGEGEGE
jgi:hypothetical protein